MSTSTLKKDIAIRVAALDDAEELLEIYKSMHLI